MILSASINLFDGEELLPALLTALRSEVDYITIVYQKVSYGGRPCSETLVAVLDYLRSAGLDDEIYEYDSVTREEQTNPQVFEAEKRTIGLDLARHYGATHFMSLDADEFIEPEVLAVAKQRVTDHNFDAASCKLIDYWMSPKYQIPGFGEAWGDFLFTPLIYKIQPNLRFSAEKIPEDYFCIADTTRKLPYDNPHRFDDDIFVHHMTTVRASRDGLMSKFLNRSSYIPPVLPPGHLVDLYRAWSPQHPWGPTINMVDDIFSIGESFSILNYSKNDFPNEYLNVHFNEAGDRENYLNGSNALNAEVDHCAAFFEKVVSDISSSVDGIADQLFSHDCHDKECIREFFKEHNHIFAGARGRINVIVLRNDGLNLMASCAVSWCGSNASRRRGIRTDTSTVRSLSESGLAAVKNNDGEWRIRGFQELW